MSRRDISILIAESGKVQVENVYTKRELARPFMALWSLESAQEQRRVFLMEEGEQEERLWLTMFMFEPGNLSSTLQDIYMKGKVAAMRDV